MKISICVALLVATMVVGVSECALCKKLSDGSFQRVEEANYKCKRVQVGGSNVVFDCSKLPAGESETGCEQCYTWTDGQANYHAPKSEMLKVAAANYTCRRDQVGGSSGVVNCDKLPEGESKAGCEPCYTWTDGFADYHAPESEIASCK